MFGKLDCVMDGNIELVSDQCNWFFVRLIDLLVLLMVMMMIQLEDELYRARCILVDGDAASFLPSKAHGSSLELD